MAANICAALLFIVHSRVEIYDVIWLPTLSFHRQRCLSIQWKLKLSAYHEIVSSFSIGFAGGKNLTSQRAEWFSHSDGSWQAAAATARRAALPRMHKRFAALRLLEILFKWVPAKSVYYIFCNQKTTQPSENLNRCVHQALTVCISNSSQLDLIICHFYQSWFVVSNAWSEVAVRFHLSWNGGSNNVDIMTATFRWQF